MDCCPLGCDAQVSLDSLWSLRKLRDEGLEQDGEGWSFFDKESLRAMPLGLGLQYASMTETQRAQIARQYAQPACSRFGSGSDAHVRVTEASGLGGNPTPRECPGHGNEAPSLRTVRLSPQALRSNASHGGRSPGAIDGPGISGEAPRWSELQNLSISQVDREVLECLPPDVRDEVLRAIDSRRVQAPTDDVTTRSPGGRRSGDGQEGNGRRSDGEARNGESWTHEGPEPRVIDVLSPPSPARLAGSRGSDEEQKEQGARRDSPARRRDGDSRIFEVEDAGTLRRALQSWIGGAVLSPSQWHLELLYRLVGGLPASHAHAGTDSLLVRQLGVSISLDDVQRMAASE